MPTKFGFHTTGEEAAAVLASQIKDKNVLITGVSPKGLGAEVARVLAKFGAGLVVLAGRNREKIEQTERDIKSETPDANLRILILDLNSFASVRTAADEALGYPESLHVLINNAGIMGVEYRKTDDGHEAHLGVNHLGHFLFTSRIFPKLRQSGGRIVNVASNGHRHGSIRFDDPGFSDGEKFDPFTAYGQSKTANMLFTRELARRGVTSFSLHPGATMTNLANAMSVDWLMRIGVYDENGQFNKNRTWKTLGQGAATHIIAAFDESIIPESGSYLVDGTVHDDLALPHAKDMESAKKLWTLNEQLVGEEFSI